MPVSWESAHSLPLVEGRDRAQSPIVYTPVVNLATVPTGFIPRQDLRSPNITAPSLSTLHLPQPALSLFQESDIRSHYPPPFWLALHPPVSSGEFHPPKTTDEEDKAELRHMMHEDRVEGITPSTLAKVWMLGYFARDWGSSIGASMMAYLEGHGRTGWPRATV